MAHKKKIEEHTVAETAPNTTSAYTDKSLLTGEELKQLMEQYPHVTLRKLAIACEISYGWVLKCSKEPIAGVPFDPTAVNYEKVATTFNKKNIDLHALDWEALNASTVRRGTSLSKDMSAFNVGDKVYLREDNEHPFEICYKTETHIVILKEGTTEPHAWSHGTFLMKGPVFEPRMVTEKTTARKEIEEAEGA